MLKKSTEGNGFRGCGSLVSRDLIGYLNDAKRSLASEAENSQLLSGKKRRAIDSLLHTQNQHPVKMAAIMNISASARVAPKVRVCPLENPRRIGRDPGGRRFRGLLHPITPGFFRFYPERASSRTTGRGVLAVPVDATRAEPPRSDAR